MKNIIYSLIIMLIVSCDTSLEVEVQDNFDFELNIKRETLNLINQNIKTSIDITPDRVVDGTEYYFSYRVKSGEGFYSLNNQELLPNQEYKLQGLKTDVFYTPKKSGNQEIEIQIKNDKGLEVIRNTSYKIVEENDFKVTLKTLNDEIFFKETTSLEFEIEKLSSELPQELTYKLKYISSTFNGKLSFDNNELAEGEELSNLSEGKINANFEALEPGDFKLEFLVTASNGIEKTVEIDLLVKLTDFDFTVITSESNDYVLDYTSFAFVIERFGAEQLSYEISFSGQNGEFRFQNTNFDNTEVINIGSGLENFVMEYRALEVSDTPIEITIKASNGVKKTKVVNYESLATNFDVIFTSEALSSLYLFNISSSFNIHVPPVNNYFLKYKFYYTTSDLGDVFLEESNTGTNIAPGEIVDLNNYRSGRFTLGQLGTSSVRKGTITFVFIDSNGIRLEKTLNVDWHN